MAIPRNLANLANQLNTDGEAPKIEVGNSSVVVTDTGSDGTIAFTTDGSERMRIDSSGNVGIGSTSPSTFGDAGTGGRNVVIQSTGVGRGVLTFASECTGGANELLGAINFIDSNSTNINYRGAAVRGVRGANDNSAYLVFNTANSGNGTERARITSAGEFLVNGTGVGDASAFSVGISGGNETFLVSKGVYSVVVTASTRDIYMDNTGYFGYITSTRNSKANIADITDVSWLYSLTPVSFNYKKFNRETNEYLDEANTELEYGLIAEDVEVVNPNLCFYDETENGQKLSGISYKKLITPMLKAIQELKAELDAAKERIAALEAQP